MATTTTLNNNIKVVLSAFGDGGEALNHNFAWLDAFLGGVIDRTDTPPGSPSEGDLYLLTGTPTGDWSTDSRSANDLALYFNSNWVYLTPPASKEGLRVWVNDEDVEYVWDGSAWNINTFGGGISNVVEDTSPQLGGDLDTNSFNIQFDTSHGIFDENNNEQILFTTTSSAVNYLNATNSATGNAVSLDAAGSDTNIDLTLSGKGSGRINAGSHIDMQGTYDIYGDTAVLASNGEIILDMMGSGSTSVNYLRVQNSASGGSPSISAQGTVGDVGMNLVTTGNGNITLDATSGGDINLNCDGIGQILVNAADVDLATHSVWLDIGSGSGIRDENSNEVLVFGQTASAVNHVKITNKDTGNNPSITSVGDDAAINLELSAKGTGNVLLNDNVTVNGTLSPVCPLHVVGPATTSSISSTSSEVAAIFEQDDEIGISLVSGSGSDASIFFGDVEDWDEFKFTFDPSAHALKLKFGDQVAFQINGTSDPAVSNLSYDCSDSSEIDLTVGGTGTNIDLALSPKGSGSVICNSPLQFIEQSSDPANPAEGSATLWMSNGTGSGDDGDIMIKITAGGTTKTATLVDFSAV